MNILEFISNIVTKINEIIHNVNELGDKVKTLEGANGSNWESTIEWESNDTWGTSQTNVNLEEW
jgi:hypothetical protein